MELEYRVVDRTTELRKGSYFYAIPDVQIETGTLALFGVGPSPFDCDFTIIGRWFPNVAGCNWILQPSRWIKVAKDVTLWIIGRIVPIDDKGHFNRLVRAGLIIQIVIPTIWEISDMLIPLVT